MRISQTIVEVENRLHEDESFRKMVGKLRRRSDQAGEEEILYYDCLTLKISKESLTFRGLQSKSERASRRVRDSL